MMQKLKILSGRYEVTRIGLYWSNFNRHTIADKWRFNNEIVAITPESGITAELLR